MPLHVNGRVVEEALIAREAAALLQRFQQMPPAERAEHGLDDAEMRKRAAEWARENLIERVLLEQEAARDPEPLPQETIDKAVEAAAGRSADAAGPTGPTGEDASESGQARGQAIRREVEARLRLDRLLGSVTTGAPKPKNKEIAAYYRKHKDEFRVPETIHAAHIVKHVNGESDEEAARNAIREFAAKLGRGESFEDLADKASDCPGNRGDLGRFARGQMVEEFDNVVFSLGVDEVSEPFQTVFGFHIAKVYGREPAGLKGLAEVRGRIEEKLILEKQNRALEDFVDRLREQAEIRDAVSPGAESEVTAP